MNLNNQQIKSKALVYQRNALLVLFVVAMGCLLVMTMAFYGQKRTVVIVPGIENSYTVDNKGSYNVTYLEDMALATAYNFLTMSRDTFSYNKRKILAIAHPSIAGETENILQQTFDILSERDISLVFTPSRIKAYPHTNRVKIEGYLARYIGEKQVSSVKKTYEVKFMSQGMTLYLKSFTEIENEENN